MGSGDRNVITTYEWNVGCLTRHLSSHLNIQSEVVGMLLIQRAWSAKGEYDVPKWARGWQCAIRLVGGRKEKGRGGGRRERRGGGRGSLV